ncbi:MAG: hypothetical protein JWP35_3034 [Caulobacter sp.]|nr:hypothetical protein [Caulobacter sp.]
MTQFQMRMRASRLLLIGVGLALSVGLQGCMAAAVAGAAVGVTGAVVGTTVKAGGAVVHVATGGKHKHKKKHHDRDD